MTNFKRFMGCVVLMAMVSGSAMATSVPADWTASSQYCNYVTSGGNPDSFVNIYVSSGGPIYTWTSSAIAITELTSYTFGLDYKAESGSSWADIIFYAANGAWAGKYELMDQTLWGYPSLNPASQWTTKSGTLVSAQYATYAIVTLYNGYATTSFDNIFLTTSSGQNLVANPGFEVPEPLTFSMLSLGALFLSRRRAGK